MSTWFSHCQTLDEARLEYRRLCFEHHPDRGGNTFVMQAINEAYSQFKDSLITNTRSRGAQRQTHATSHWQRPVRERPRDVPPEHSGPQPKPEAEPKHSRDYLHHTWNTGAWQQLANGNLGRELWGHTVILVRHPAAKFEGAWFVLLDNAFSPYFYASRHEAEQAAFDLLYEKVKYQEF